MSKIKNKKIVITLFIIGIILLIIGGLFVYKNINISIVNNNNNISKLSIEDYNKYYVKIQKEANYLDLNLVEKYPINDIEKLDSKEKTLFVLQMISNYRDKEVTVEQLNQEMKKHFTKYDIYKKNIKSSSGNILYKYNNNKFIYNSADANECNCFTKKISNDANASTWVLKKKLYYTRSSKVNDVIISTVFSNIDDCNNKKNSLYSFEGNLSVLSDEDYKKLKGKLDTYIYTFVKDGQIYKIKSVISNDKL